jgi:hypothetical protein
LTSNIASKFVLSKLFSGIFFVLVTNHIFFYKNNKSFII